MSFFSEIGGYLIGLVAAPIRMRKMEEKTDSIVNNYTTQFKEIRKDIAEGKLQTFEKIDKMHLDIVDRINKG